MSISPAEILKIEKKWGVDIEKQPDGSYEVTSDPTHSFINAYSNSDTQYKINVKPIEEEITINPDYAKAVGVDLTGDIPTDMANLNRTTFQAAEGSEDFYNNYPGFVSTHLHRSACVAAWLRSDGQIPPEAWHANPAFGASGAGAKIEIGGGQGGKASTIGPAHDTDHVLGAAANIGPMAVLGDFVSKYGTLPAGMHGIPHVADHLGSPFSKEEYENYLQEREMMPELQNIPSYDWLPDGKPGWTVERIEHGYLSEAEIDPNEMGNMLAQIDDYIEAGGDPDLLKAYLEASEEGKALPEDQQLAWDQQFENKGNSANNEIDAEYSNTDDDYGIV